MHRSRWLWRWRSNPLRQRTYLVEAWAAVTVSLLAVGGAVVTGAATTDAAEHRFAGQHLDRHRTTAVLVQDASEPTGYAAQPRALVRWTAADGTSRSGSAKVDSAATTGTRVTVWTDARGAIVPAPLSPSQARLEAGLSGAAAASGVCGGSLVAWGLARSFTDRRRTRRWAAEWEVVGPRWSHHNA